MAGSDGGALDQEQADAVRIEYRALLMEGEVECPPPDGDSPLSYFYLSNGFFELSFNFNLNLS
jgi:hypothetical protein